jgi:uncharacterized protein (DUF2237 family)
VAITQLAQTTLRSVIGKMELDKTFEERDLINASVVSALDEAALNWGVKVLRYEIKDLTPPAEILRSMQAQITAEREKRALIAASEGRRQEQINIATGEREAFIARSEGEKQAEINKAQGEAGGHHRRGRGHGRRHPQGRRGHPQPGGEQAVQLKVAEKAVEAYAKLAQKNNTMIVPGNMTEVSALIGTAMALLKGGRADQVSRPPSAMPAQPDDPPRPRPERAGHALVPCSYDPLTGWYRDGCCHTDAQDHGSHVICAKVTVEFLNFQMERGNDLITPRPEYRFRGLKPGDRWCVCALRWREAYEAGCAPPVVLESTHAGRWTTCCWTGCASTPPPLQPKARIAGLRNAEGWMSGLSRTPGKRVGVNSPPRVRIPPLRQRSGLREPLTLCDNVPDKGRSAPFAG